MLVLNITYYYYYLLSSLIVIFLFNNFYFHFHYIIIYDNIFMASKLVGKLGKYGIGNM